MGSIAGVFFFIAVLVLIGAALVWAGYTPTAEPKEDPRARVGDRIHRQARQLDATAYRAKGVGAMRIDLTHRSMPLTLTMDRDSEVVSLATSRVSRARFWPALGLRIMEAPRAGLMPRLSRDGGVAQETGDAAFDAMFQTHVRAREDVALVTSEVRSALLALRELEGVVWVALSRHGLSVDVNAEVLAEKGRLSALLEAYAGVHAALNEAQAKQHVGVKLR